MTELKGLILFELKSYFGRIFLKKRSVITPKYEPMLLDIGVGSNYRNGWMHIDFYIIKNPLKSIFQRPDKKKTPEIQTDLRFPLMCSNNIIDGVYSSHTLEHLNNGDAYNLLKEIFRVLKPGCFARIIVPDLEKIIEFYLGKNNDFEFDTGCEAIGSLTQHFGHKSVWDTIYLSKICIKAGFIKVRKVKYGSGGTDKALIKELPGREFESIVIEAMKPL